MPLSIRIISSPDQETISEWNKQFPEEGGDIGRSFGSTWQLNDASRELSNTHAIISKSAAGYHILDNSSNGVFVNGSTKPLGKGNKVPLNDGDVLDMGRFRLLVSCFITSQTKSSTGLNNEEEADITGSDDPFNMNLDETPIEPEVAEPVTVLNSGEHGVIEDDPFAKEANATVQQSVKPTSTDFNDIDEDPFSDSPITPSFVGIEDADTPAVNLTGQALATNNALVNHSEISADLEQALEMAFFKFVQELAPNKLEAMFNDLATPGLFSRKPDYWKLYQRYFKRQIDSGDLKFKFQAYVRESVKIQQRLKGENS